MKVRALGKEHRNEYFKAKKSFNNLFTGESATHILTAFAKAS
jgi:hypothetical protein